jgi:hypothetical protein
MVEQFQQWGAIMLVFILNAIYRQFLRAILPGIPGKEGSYDRCRHGRGCHIQHRDLLGSCFRRVSDALMGRSALPTADPGTV